MECTLISKTLDVVDQMIAERGDGSVMPQSMLIGADNTAREGNNQHFAMYNAWLSGEEVFDATQADYNPKGHTHNGQDQRFADAAVQLSRAPCLEDPQAFKVSGPHF